MGNSKKVVVFGGGGFLGSHVADTLTKKGYEVIIYDIHNSQFIGEKQKMIVGDILDPEKVNEAVRDTQYVYHFAGLADINEAKAKPVEKTEVKPTEKKVEAKPAEIKDVPKEKPVERVDEKPKKDEVKPTEAKEKPIEKAKDIPKVPTAAELAEKNKK